MPTLEEQIAAASKALRDRLMPPVAQTEDEDRSPKSLFVYGTLMYPSVLKRVTRSDGEHLESCQAVLPDHRLFCVKDRDYPALQGRSGSSVKGLIIRNLTSQEISLIDEYEGEEYAISQVSVTLTSPFHPISDHSHEEGVKAVLDPKFIPSSSSDTTTVLCCTWNASLGNLLEKAWQPALLEPIVFAN